jgi:hypothetical protein
METEMRQRISIGITLGFAMLLVALPAAAKRHYVEGHVIKVQLQQQVATQNRDELNELTIRTREGQELRLLLGRGPCDACPRVGDRVRARLMKEVHAADEPQLCDVRKLRNLTRHEQLRVRDRSGNLVTTRHRARLGDGSSGRRDGGGERKGGLKSGKRGG